MKSNNKQSARKSARVGKGSVQTQKQVTVPVSKGKTIKQGSPLVTGSKGVFRIEHSERVMALVTANGNGPVTGVIRLQPTDSSTFPWLCQIADRFEKYRFKRLEFEYTNVVGTNSQGLIALGVDFDPDDSSPPTADDDGFQSIMAHSGAVQTPIWSSVRLTIPPSQLEKVGERWLRNWEGETAVEARTADVGNLLYGVFGTFYDLDWNPQWVGELRVHYNIELMMPQLNKPTEEAGPCRLEFSVSENNGMSDENTQHTVFPGYLAEVPLEYRTGSIIDGDVVETASGPDLLEVVENVPIDGTNMTCLRCKDDFEGTIRLETLRHAVDPRTKVEIPRYDLMEAMPATITTPGATLSSIPKSYCTATSSDWFLPSAPGSAAQDILDAWNKLQTVRGWVNTEDPEYSGAISKSTSEWVGRFLKGAYYFFQNLDEGDPAYTPNKLTNVVVSALPRVISALLAGPTRPVRRIQYAQTSELPKGTVLTHHVGEPPKLALKNEDRSKGKEKLRALLMKSPPATQPPNTLKTTPGSLESRVAKPCSLKKS